MATGTTDNQTEGLPGPQIREYSHPPHDGLQHASDTDIRGSKGEEPQEQLRPDEKSTKEGKTRNSGIDQHRPRNEQAVVPGHEPRACEPGDQTRKDHLNNPVPGK